MTAGSPDLNLPPLQRNCQQVFAEHLYGPIPAPPKNLTIQRQNAERIEIGLGSLTIDAALWLPPDQQAPCPVICGLDFTAPEITQRTDQPPSPWPVDLITNAGFAVLASCYSNWVPDDPSEWKNNGLATILEPETRAISLWAWAIQRLVDCALSFPEIDPTAIAVAGHSRLGKAALWAAANDPRITTVFANNSGCGGAAPARHPMGETLVQMADRFPHWILPNPAYADPASLPFDQHQLLASIAPRRLYIASAKDDEWSDPTGTYQALQAAAPAWKSDQDAIGHHLREGGHDLTHQDWVQFLKFASQNN